MSEYEYHEFLAIDRPFGAEARKAFSSLSSRANVTSRSAAFVNHWGSFRGDPWMLVKQHADFHFQLAWYCVCLHMRLPAGAIAADLLALFEEDECCGISAQRAGDGFVIGFSTGQEHCFNGWLEGDAMADSLAPLREEMLNGDYRFLYLGWLYGIQWSLGMGADRSWERGDDDYNDKNAGDDAGVPSDDAAILDSCEPPVPAGLGQLTSAQQFFAELVGLDKFLLAAAAEVSREMRKSDEPDLTKMLSRLSEDERIGYLAELVKDEPSVQLRLRRRLAEMWKAEQGPASPPPSKRRRVRDILKLASVLKRAEQERRGKRAEEERVRKAALRRKEIIALAPEMPRLWAKVLELIDRKLPAAYDEAMPVLADLRDVAAYKGEVEAFASRIQEVATTYRKRSALISRLKKGGFLPQAWRAS